MARWNEDERWMSDEDREEQRRWRSERQGQEWRAQDWRGDVRRDEWRGTEGRGAERGREWEERGRGYGRGGEWGGGDWERERSGLGMGGRSEEGWRPTGHRESGGHGSSGYGGGRYGSSGGGTYGGSSGRMGSSSGGMYGGTDGGSRGGYESRGMWGEERGYERDPYGRDLSRQGGSEGRYEEQGPFERMGERMKEGFRKLTGKGPKGYKRSDERIREDVSERIARSWVNADEVEVKVEGGVVTLTGFVENREDKRRIEDVADDVFGVDEVENHIRIRRDTGTQTTGTQAAGTQTASSTGTQAGQRTTPGTAQRPGQH